MEEDVITREARRVLERVGDGTGRPAGRGGSAESNPVVIDVEAVRRRVAAASGTTGATGGRGGGGHGGRRIGDRVNVRKVVRTWAPRLPVVLAVLALVVVALTGGSDSGGWPKEDDGGTPEPSVSAGDDAEEGPREGDDTQPDAPGDPIPLPSGP